MLIVSFGAASLVQAQDKQEIKIDNRTTLWVDGTSTLHDWTVESGAATGAIAVNKEGIQMVFVQVASETLQSGKSGMDRRMYEALETRRHRHVTFTSEKIELNADRTGGVAIGELTIAGQTRTHEVPFTIERSGSDWTFNGSTAFTMSSFGITPPTAVMGTVRTGDEITVRFKISTARPIFISSN